MTATTLTDEVLNGWADDPAGPVALTLRQQLAPVEESRVIFPPTYAGDNESIYNIDTLADGTRVATIDSVGSQANRMEPIFKAATNGGMPNPLAALVPQVDIQIDGDRKVSILEAGHRLGDAIIRSSSLKDLAKAAFESFLAADAGPLAKLSPTSLVFGAWDSRDTAAKLPRIVQAVVRAWSVDVLRCSAQYSPPVDYSSLDVFSEEDKAKSENNPKSPLAQRGFVHNPATEALGGIFASGPIVRDVTVNLVALRRLEANEKGRELRRYVLGLSLVAAADPGDGFYRQGCLLTLDPAAPGEWVAVSRDGKRGPVGVTAVIARDYAKRAAEAFGVGENRTATFDRKLAKADVAEAGKKGGGKKKGNQAGG
jgi:CRISPR-associated protein Csb1